MGPAKFTQHYEVEFKGIITCCALIPQDKVRRGSGAARGRAGGLQAGHDRQSSFDQMGAKLLAAARFARLWPPTAR